MANGGFICEIPNSFGLGIGRFSQARNDHMTGNIWLPDAGRCHGIHMGL